MFCLHTFFGYRTRGMSKEWAYQQREPKLLALCANLSPNVDDAYSSGVAGDAALTLCSFTPSLLHNYLPCSLTIQFVFMRAS
jgi:hypothetical protein